MKTIKQTMIERISQIIQNGNLEDLDILKQEILNVLDEETDIESHLCYNPLLQEKYNTFEMLDGRKQKYLKLFQAYVLATKDEYQLKTYGEAKRIAIENLINDFTGQLEKLPRNSKNEAKLFLELKLFDKLFEKYTNQLSGMYMTQYGTLICIAQYCRSENIKDFFQRMYD